MAESLQVAGLASGFDWKSLVDQLTQLERVPVARLNTEKTALNRQSDALGTLKGLIDGLSTNAKSFTSSSSFYTRTATLGSTTAGVIRADAAPRTPTGSYAVEVIRTATATKRTGTADVGGSLNATNNVSSLTLADARLGVDITAGNFTINGQRITVATTDSLQDVFDDIATATAGAVTAAYDPVADKVTLSGSGPISLGSGGDTSNFLAAFGLYGDGTNTVTSNRRLGRVDADASLANSGLAAISNVDGSGNGTFAINGVSISFNVNSDSIRTLTDKIRASEAGVDLTYDPSGDGFALTSRGTGSLGLEVSETANGVLAAMGLTAGAVTLGDNAQYRINGGATLTSASNNFTDATHGIPGLSVTALKNGTETVTVAADTATSQKRIDDFLTKYNELQKKLEDLTKTTTGSGGKVSTSVLTDNREVGSLGRTLRQEIFRPLAGNGSVQRLQDIGIDFNTGSNELSIKDSTKLTRALQENPDGVAKLFSDSTDGIAKRIDAFATRLGGSTGVLSKQQDTIGARVRRVDDQIAATERRITAQKNSLTNSFLRMEEVQSQLQRQLQALNQTFK